MTLKQVTPSRLRPDRGPDEWQVSDRRYLSEGSMALIDAEPTDQPTCSQPLEITQEVATNELIAS